MNKRDCQKRLAIPLFCCNGARTLWGSPWRQAKTMRWPRRDVFITLQSEPICAPSSMPFVSRLNAPRESAQHYLWVGSNRGLSYGGKTTETSEQSNGLRVDQTACSRKSDTACIVFSLARCSLRNRYKMVLNILYINIITCITPDTNRYSKVYRLYRWRYSIRCWIICW